MSSFLAPQKALTWTTGILAVLSGTFSLLAQTLLIREALGQGNTELSLGLLLAHWLMGVGLGAGITARHLRLHPQANPTRRLRLFWGLALLYLPLAILAARLLPLSLPSLAPVYGQWLSALLLLLPLGLCAGASLPLLIHRAQPTGSPRQQRALLTRLYVLESLGALAGGALHTGLLAGAVPPLPLALGLGLLLLPLLTPSPRKALSPFLLLWALPALLLSPLPGLLESWSLNPGRPSRQTTISILSSRFEQLTLSGSPQHPEIRANRRLLRDEQRVTPELEAHLSPSGQPHNPLVLIGLPSGILLTDLRQIFPDSDILILEADPSQIRLREQEDPLFTTLTSADHGIHLLAEDPRLALRQRSPINASLVWLLQPFPQTLLHNRVFTREAFQDICRHLAANGRLLLPPPPPDQRARILERTLTPLFTPLEAFSPKAGLPLMFLKRSPASVPTSQKEGPVNRDLIPALIAPHLLERTGPPGNRISAFLTLTCLLILLATALKSGWIPTRTLRLVPPLVMLAGMGGMGAQMLIITLFQIRFGSLYHFLGLLNGFFMAGLPLGAWIMHRTLHSRNSRAHIRALVIPLLCLGLLILALPHLILSAGLWMAPALALASALLVGGVYPAAAGFLLRQGMPTVDTGAALSGSDHWGGALCAFLLGGLLLPDLGIPSPMLWLSLLLMGGSLLPLTLRIRPTRPTP